MSIDIKSLLSTSASDIKKAPRFPNGNYRFIITGYKIATWSKSEGVGVALEFKPTASVEADDEANPEIAAEQREKLEVFGDWPSRVFGKGTTWYEDRETHDAHLLVSALTFTLQDKEGALSKGASFFYVNDNGEEGGFVYDVLGVSVPEGTELGAVLEECINKEFYATVGYEIDRNDPKRENLVITNPSS